MATQSQQQFEVPAHVPAELVRRTGLVEGPNSSRRRTTSAKLHEPARRFSTTSAPWAAPA
jgi:hypothetical protein